MNKRKLHHQLTNLKQINTWVIVVLILISSAVSIYALRQNNLKMIELRNNLLAVDRVDGDKDAALRALGDHITNHMNTDMNRPVELVESFNRAVEVATEEAQEQTNSDIYRKAQNNCEVASIPLTARAQCIQDYVTENAAPGENPAPLELPSKDLYIYDWASPRWSPDLAGWSLFTAATLILFLILKAVTIQLIKRTLKQHN